MEKWSIALLAVSLGLFLYGAVGFISRRTDRLTRRLVRLTGGLIGSILTLELAFAVCGGRKLLPFTLLTEVMQAFSLDANYHDVISRSWAVFPWPWLNACIPWYTLVIYTLAPVVGGAVIYDVLAGVSPAVAMSMHRRRELYIFSELNERSVLLAESITAQADRTKKYALVFTDVYVDESQEAETELLMRAKALGAICLQDDLLHCTSFRKSKKCRFFLMDMAEGDDFNDVQDLTTLHGLLPVGGGERGRQAPLLWDAKAGCVIYFFTNSIETIENVRSLKKTFYRAREDREHLADPIAEVELHVFRDHARAALALMEKHPLYLPLGEARPGKQTPLRVVLFGGGPFAREMFKAVFWCGQILDTQLYITVVTRRSRTDGAGGARPEFLQWMDELCPELAESCQQTGADSGPECLRIWPEDVWPAEAWAERKKFAPPYARLSFIETDGQPDMRQLLARDDQRMHDGAQEHWRLADCDYFLVMEPSDLDNIALADSIRSALMYLHLQSASQRDGGKQVISFAVRSDSLLHVVRDRFEQCRDVVLPPTLVRAPEMHPFGNLAEQFSWKNVSMDEAQLNRSEAEQAAARAEHSFADANEPKDQLYDEWSTAARRFHLRYKLFCAGCLQGPARPTTRDLLTYYRTISEDSSLTDRLTWLEHRRWSAFLRVNGFTRPFVSIDEVRRYMPEITGVLRAKTNREAVDVIRQAAEKKCLKPEELAVPPIYGSKDVPYRLHPCLVESSPEAYRDAEHYDMLDVITAARIYDQLRPALAGPDSGAVKPDGSPAELKKYDKPTRYLPRIDKDEARRTIPEDDPLYPWIDRYPEKD